MEDCEKIVLLERLEREKASRLQQETLISKLKKDQSELRRKLAQAEGHIDKMRFGANVEIKEHYILTHQSKQTATLQQKLQVHGPSKEEGTSVGQPLEPGRELKNVATGLSDSSEDGKFLSEQGLTLEELGSGNGMDFAGPSRSVRAGTHAAVDLFSESSSNNQRDGNGNNVSPFESPELLSPRSEIFTPQPKLPDSNQLSDGEASFWLADITPPSCDLDSSIDSDMEFAKEAVRKESSILSEVYEVFGDLDEYERSRVGQGHAEGSVVGNKLDGDECMNSQQLTLARIANELLNEEEEVRRPDSMKRKPSPRYRKIQGNEASNERTLLPSVGNNRSSETNSGSLLLDLEQMSLDNKQQKNPGAVSKPISQHLSKGRKIKPPQVRSNLVQNLPAEGVVPAGSGRLSGHQQGGGMQTKPEFRSRIPRPTRKSQKSIGPSHSRTMEANRRKNLQPISEPVTSACPQTRNAVRAGVEMDSGNATAISHMTKVPATGHLEKRRDYEVLKFTPSFNEDAKSCTSSSSKLSDTSTVYKVSSKRSASVQTESKEETTSPPNSPIRFMTLPDKMSRQTSTMSLQRSRSNTSSVSTSNRREKQYQLPPHEPRALDTDVLQRVGGDQPLNSGDERQRSVSKNSESVPKRFRLQSFPPLGPDSAYNTMICSSEEEYGSRDKQVQCEMQNGVTHNSSNGIFVSSMGFPSTQASSIHMSYCSFHNSKILAGSEPLSAQAGGKRGVCATCHSKTAPVQRADGNGGPNVTETGGFHSGAMTSDVANTPTPLCSSPKHHVVQQDTGCKLCGGSKSLLEQWSIEQSSGTVGGSQTTMSTKTTIPPLESLSLAENEKEEKLKHTTQFTGTDNISAHQHSPLHPNGNLSTGTLHTTGEQLGAVASVEDLPPSIVSSIQSTPRSDLKRPLPLHGNPVLNSDYLDALKKELKKLRSQVAKTERSRVESQSSSMTSIQLSSGDHPSSLSGNGGSAECLPRSLPASLDTLNSGAGEGSGSNILASSHSSATNHHSVNVYHTAHDTRNFMSSDTDSGRMGSSILSTQNSHVRSQQSSGDHPSSTLNSSYGNSTSALPFSGSEIRTKDVHPMNKNHPILSPFSNSSHGSNASLSSLACSGKSNFLPHDTPNLQSSSEHHGSHNFYPTIKSSTLPRGSADLTSNSAASVEKSNLGSGVGLNTPVRSPMHTGVLHKFTNTTPNCTSTGSSVEFTPLRMQVGSNCQSLDRIFVTESSPRHGSIATWSGGHRPSNNSGLHILPSAASKNDLATSSLVSMHSYQLRKSSSHPPWSPNSGIQTHCSENLAGGSILSSPASSVVMGSKTKSVDQVGIASPVRSASQIELVSQIGSTSQMVESTTQIGSITPSQTGSTCQMTSTSQIRSGSEIRSNNILSTGRIGSVQMESSSQIKSTSLGGSTSNLGSTSQSTSNSQIRSSSQIGSNSLIQSTCQTGSINQNESTSHVGSSSQMGSSGPIGSTSQIGSNGQIGSTNHMGSTKQIRSTSQMGSISQIESFGSTSQIDSNIQMEPTNRFKSTSQTGSSIQMGSASQFGPTSQTGSSIQMGSNSLLRPHSYFPMQCTSHPSSLNIGSQAALSSVESHLPSPSFQPAISQNSVKIFTPEKSMSVPNSDNSLMNNLPSVHETESSPLMSVSPKEISNTPINSGISIYQQVEHFTPIHPSIVSETVYGDFVSLGSSIGTGYTEVQQAPASSTAKTNTPKSGSGFISSTSISPLTTPARLSEKSLSVPVQSDSELLKSNTPVQYQKNVPVLRSTPTPVSNSLPSHDFNSKSLLESKGSSLSLEVSKNSQSTAAGISITSEQCNLPLLSCFPVSDTSSFITSISRGPKKPIDTTNSSSNTTPSHWSSKNVSLYTGNPNPAFYNSSESPYSSIVRKSSIDVKESSNISTPVITDPQDFLSESAQQEPKSFSPFLQSSQEIQSGYNQHTSLNSGTVVAGGLTPLWTKPITHSQDTLHNFSPLSSTPLHEFHLRSMGKSFPSSVGSQGSLLPSQKKSPSVVATPHSNHHETVGSSSPLLSDFQYNLLISNSELDDKSGQFDFDSSFSVSSKPGPPLSSPEQQDSTLENSSTNNGYLEHSSGAVRFLDEQSSVDDEEQLLQTEDTNQEEIDDLMDSKDGSETFEKHANDGFDLNDESVAFEPTFDSGTYSITSHCDIDDALSSPTFSLRRSSRFLVSDAPNGTADEDSNHTPSSRRNIHAYDRISRSSAERSGHTSLRRGNSRGKSYSSGSTNSFDKHQSDALHDKKSTPVGSPNDYNIGTPAKFPVHSSHSTFSHHTSHLVTAPQEPVSTDSKHLLSKIQSRQQTFRNEPGLTDHSTTSNRNSSGSIALWIPKAKPTNSPSKSTRSKMLMMENRGGTPYANSSPSHSYQHYHSMRRNYPSTSSEYGNSSFYTGRQSQSSTSADYTATGTHLHSGSFYPEYQRYNVTNDRYPPIRRRETFMANLPARQQDISSNTGQHPYHRTAAQSLEGDGLTLSPQRNKVRQGKSPRRGPRYSHRIELRKRHSLQDSEQRSDVDLQPSLLMAFNLHRRSKRMQVELLRDLQRYEHQKRNSHLHSIPTHHNSRAVHFAHQSYSQSKPSSFHRSFRQ